MNILHKLANGAYANGGDAARECGYTDDDRRKKDGYYDICWRVLENGIMNLFLLDGDGGKNVRHLFRLARSWVFAEDQTDPFSFDKLWSLVYPDIDIERAKKELAIKCDEIEKLWKNSSKAKVTRRRKSK